MKCAVVVGSTRGIGLEVVRQVCQEHTDWAVYLTARNKDSGEAAIAKLQECSNKPRLALFDLADEGTIKEASKQILEEVGGVDVMVINGAFAAPKDAAPASYARQMIKTNNYGCAQALQHFRPLLREGGRVVIVASGFGTLSGLSAELRAKLDTERITVEDLNGTLDAYVTAVEADAVETGGWPNLVNKMSKTGQVALARIFARDLRQDPSAPKDILVNAVCPGWTWTEAAKDYIEASAALQAQAKSPKEAAVDVVWLATLPQGTTEPYGELLQYRQLLPWDA
mmetsp:Transcript_51437/g.95168  ORF Transcript_51437/g.95168 Transcript_51437/m.95168 type:complete len:283 (-) Transcript_51437:97-945(-)